MHATPDPEPHAIHEARLRLIGSADDGFRRSIVLGRAVLERPAGGRCPWTLAVRADGPLEPPSPHRSSDTTSGLIVHRRTALAIAVPNDFRGGRIQVARRLLETRRNDRRKESDPTMFRTIYGWSLAYRFENSTGPAIVDPNDDLPDLPAFYESPAELMDRILYLESRGVETRPIALLVNRRDFIRDERGDAVNRYFPSLGGPRPLSPD